MVCKHQKKCSLGFHENKNRKEIGGPAGGGWCGVVGGESRKSKTSPNNKAFQRVKSVFS